jgi:hypothetical protein
MDPDITEIEDAVRRLPAAERVRLIEAIAHSLREPEPDSSQDKTALARFLDEMSSLPRQSPMDDFSNRDHDHLLYNQHR